MPHAGGQLKREIGLFHAVLLGLGSILGTGVFVSIGIAAGVAGPAVLVAIVLAALLALCNGLSSAQLAAAHPVAGGTYEYGYRYLNDKLGFTAGWMFLCAKSASAATAALAVVGYLSQQFLDDYQIGTIPYSYEYLDVIGVTLLVVVVVSTVVLFGLRRSSAVNSVLVLITLAGLLAVCIFVYANSLDRMPLDAVFIQGHPYVKEGWHTLLSATALMFVAFTGYGRIATLGEEVHDPRKTIPAAILVTLAVSALLYLAIGYALLLSGIGFSSFEVRGFADGRETSPLLYAVRNAHGTERLMQFVALAAITAMLGVLLNLILGLSRVALAMGRRGDLPRVFAKVNASGTTPTSAVLLVAGIIMALTLVGDVKATWSFAAFTVLIYYGITNLACLRLPEKDRLYPRAFAWAGLLGCFFLAWWVEPKYWGIGLLVIIVGLFWRGITQVRHPYVREVHDAREFCAQCGYDLRASIDACPECGTAIPDPDTDADQT